MNTGALPRPKDKRDFKLGKIQAPIQIPDTFLPDNSWIQVNYQGQTPMCGEHAGTHLKVILDSYTDQIHGRKTPRYGAVKLKDPKSLTYDGYPIEDGTDMRSIFKWLQVYGADDFEPLGNDVTLPLNVYCSPQFILPEMDANAAQSKIKSYAFIDNPSVDELKQSIYQNKAVLLLIHCDDGFWGTQYPTFNSSKYGHFVVADGYTPNSIRIIDSADSRFPIKYIGTQYIGFIIESGTALDLPNEVIANLRQQISLLQKVVALLKQLLHL